MKGTKLLLLLSLVSCGSRMEKPVAVIDSKDFQYKECFYESDSRVKGQGQVTIGLTVLPNGKVDDEKILASDFKDANFHACLLEMTRDMKFPPSPSGNETKVTKVINFSTKIKMNN